MKMDGNIHKRQAQQIRLLDKQTLTNIVSSHLMFYIIKKSEQNWYKSIPKVLKYSILYMDILPFYDLIIEFICVKHNALSFRESRFNQL